jgi:hypothetical protein
MKPVKLSAENFKGLQFDHELKLVNMFTGPNESGKSARIRAALVALLGYDPSIGKQPSATFGYASEMSTLPLTVHMEFDNGTHITRTFTKNKKGVSRTETGEIPEIPEVLFNASDYLGATNQERIKAIFEKIDVSQIVIKDDDLIAKLSAIEVTPAVVCQKAQVDLKAFVKASIKRRVNFKQTVQIWLEELVKGLQEKAKGEKGLMEGASGELAALKSTGKTPESQAARIKEVQAKIDEIQTRFSAMQSQIAAHALGNKRREEISAALAKPLPDTSALEKQKAEGDAKVSSYKSTTAELHSNLRVIEQEIIKVDSQAAEQKRRREEIEKRLVELEGKVKCPYCGSNKQGWKDDHKLELQGKLETVHAEEKKFSDRATWARDQAATLKSDVALALRADASIAILRNDLLKIDKELASARDMATKRAALEGELKGLTTLTPPSKEDIEKIASELASARKELEPLQTAEILFTQSQANAGKFKDTEARLISHQVRQELFKRAAQLVIGEQQAIVEKAFDSILTPARRFTDGIVGGTLGYQDGEFGVQTDRGWVGHKFLAESRKEIVYLGLQVALAQQSPVKIILLDELGVFDQPSKRMVVDRFLALAREGFIHAALCADPAAESYQDIKDPDFQLVKL